MWHAILIAAGPAKALVVNVHHAPIAYRPESEHRAITAAGGHDGKLLSPCMFRSSWEVGMQGLTMTWQLCCIGQLQCTPRWSSPG